MKTVLRYWRHVRDDELLRNSFYIFLTTATMAALGSLFWLVNTRLYSADDIGRATSLISATTLISCLSLFGFNTAVVRFLPSSPDRSRDINSALVVVFTAGLALSAAFVALLPWLAPELDWVRQSLPLAVAFSVMAACSAANLFTDSVFVATRSAKYNVLIDGVVQGFTRILLAVLLAGIGSFGIVAAAGVGSIVAVLLSVVAMMLVVGYRPRVRLHWASVRRMGRFSAAIYTGSLFDLIPVLVLPLMVLNALGPEAAGYYFIAYQIANLLYAIAYAVAQSLLAEGSHDGVQLVPLLRRSATVLGWAIVPPAIVVALAGRSILLVFGEDYSRHGASALVVLSLAAVSVATHAWVSTALKFTGQLHTLIWMNVAYAGVVVGTAALTIRWGLVWVSVAWLLGNLAATAIGGWALASRPDRGVFPPANGLQAAGTPADPAADGDHRGRPSSAGMAAGQARR